MKNSILFFFLLLLVACNKHDEPGINDKQSSTGSAFTLKNSGIDGLTRLDTFFTDTNTQATYNYTDFYFNLDIDFYVLENYQLLHSLSTPLLDYYYAHNQSSNIEVSQDKDTAKPILELQHKTFSPSSADYTHLIIMDPGMDANVIYFANTGFFLQQYLDKALEVNPKSIIKIGFYNRTNNTLNIESENIMAEFYEKTKQAQKNSLPSFSTHQSDQLLSQIELGISNPPGDTTNRHITVLTYSLFDNANVDSVRLKLIQDDLEKKNITFNVISLLPVDFLQELAFQSEGFFHNDISFLDNSSNFENNPDEFEKLVDNGVFPSSVILQNMEQLIAGSANNFNRYSIPSVYRTYDNITTAVAKERLRKQLFHINWNSNSGYFKRELEIKPIIK